MGLICCKLFVRRKSIGRYGLELEQLDKEVESLKQYKAQQINIRRNIIKGLLLYCTALYAILLASLYVYTPSKQYSYIKPLLIILIPLIIFLVKYSLDGYFNRNIYKAQKNINSLEEQRDKMIRELEDDEEYIKRKRLLDNYRKKQDIKQQVPQPININNNNKQNTNITNNHNNNNNTNRNSKNIDSKTTNTHNNNTNTVNNCNNDNKSIMAPGNGLTASDSRVLARADIIAVSKRGPLDKVVDYLLQDGPNSRYALICKSCFTHNGLVREEELSKIRFRCTYCNDINGPPLPQNWRPNIFPAPQPPTTPAHYKHNNNNAFTTPMSRVNKPDVTARQSTIQANRVKSQSLTENVQLSDDDDSLLFSTKKPEINPNPNTHNNKTDTIQQKSSEANHNTDTTTNDPSANNSDASNSKPSAA